MENTRTALTRWIEATLANDESSTDQELVQHFQTEGGMSESEALSWVSRRGEFLS